jgi:hypothetical protein
MASRVSLRTREPLEQRLGLKLGTTSLQDWGQRPHFKWENPARVVAASYRGSSPICRVIG